MKLGKIRHYITSILSVVLFLLQSLFEKFSEGFFI